MDDQKKQIDHRKMLEERVPKEPPVLIPTAPPETKRPQVDQVNDLDNFGPDFRGLKVEGSSWKTIQVREATYQGFKKLADRDGVPVNRVINHVLETYLKKNTRS